jgi:hypothetical protein
MKITFNLQGVGLADNGGSATIVNSANVLSKLGHKVTLVSEKENQFTWAELDGPEYVKTNGTVADYSDSHVLVATGVHSVQHVLNAPSRKGSKFWWIRAHESWAINEATLRLYYQNSQLQLIANSQCLKAYITSKIRNLPISVARPGMDLEQFRPTIGRIWKGKVKFTLGGLYCDKPRKRTQWITEIYEACKARSVPVDLHLFGTHKKPIGTGASKYLKSPNKDMLRRFYNNIDFWLAPTESEGLHMPPQEAMLCHCVVIGANEPLSGMKDYLMEKSNFGKTGFVMNHWNDAVDIIYDHWGKDREELQYISENGRNQILSMGNREDNMKKLIQCFEKRKDPHTLRRLELEMRRRRGR